LSLLLEVTMVKYIADLVGIKFSIFNYQRAVVLPQIYNIIPTIAICSSGNCSAGRLV